MERILWALKTLPAPLTLNLHGDITYQILPQNTPYLGCFNKGLSMEVDMPALVPDDTPTYAVPEVNLIPPNDYLMHQISIPASRMFLINKSLKVFHNKYPDRPMYDASQGDGGASLPGVPAPILDRAAHRALARGLANVW